MQSQRTEERKSHLILIVCAFSYFCFNLHRALTTHIEATINTYIQSICRSFTHTFDSNAEYISHKHHAISRSTFQFQIEKSTVCNVCIDTHTHTYTIHRHKSIPYCPVTHKWSDNLCMCMTSFSFTDTYADEILFIPKTVDSISFWLIGIAIIKQTLLVFVVRISIGFYNISLVHLYWNADRNTINHLKAIGATETTNVYLKICKIYQQIRTFFFSNQIRSILGSFLFRA